MAAIAREREREREWRSVGFVDLRVDGK